MRVCVYALVCMSLVCTQAAWGCCPVDAITLGLVVFNASAGPVVCVGLGSDSLAWSLSAPCRLSVMAVCLALAWPFLCLPEATVWPSLLALVLWDVVAVSPWGPLRYIVRGEQVCSVHSSWLHLPTPLLLPPPPPHLLLLPTSSPTPDRGGRLSLSVSSLHSSQARKAAGLAPLLPSGMEWRGATFDLGTGDLVLFAVTVGRGVGAGPLPAAATFAGVLAGARGSPPPLPPSLFPPHPTHPTHQRPGATYCDLISRRSSTPPLRFGALPLA